MTSGFIDAVPAYMWSAQGRSCKVCVNIFIYVCIYNIPELYVPWILRAVHPPQPRNVTWHPHTQEYRGCDSFTAVLLLQVVPFFFSSSSSYLRSLFCSSVTGGSRVVSEDGYSELEEGSFPLRSSCASLCSAAWEQTCSRDANRVISAACECTGLRRRLKFICTNNTWGPLDGIKIFFLLTCIKFYFLSRVEFLCKYRLYRNKRLQALLWVYGSTCR